MKAAPATQATAGSAVLSEAQAVAALRDRLRQVEESLREARETIEALRTGDVDAIVIHGPVGPYVYTLDNDDRPYRRLIEQIGEGALTLTPEGVILYCNKRMAALLRMPHEKVIGGKLQRMFAGDDQGKFAHLLARGKGRGDLTLQSADGGRIPVYLSLTRLVDGGMRTLCAIVTDLTDQKQAEAALGEVHARLVAETAEREAAEARFHQAQKMEAVGQLTGGVAHDFNNLLTVVLGGLDMIGRQLPGLPPGPSTTRIGRGMTIARMGADRSAVLIQQLLAFSRRQPLDPRPVDANLLLSGMIEMLHRTIGESIALDADLAEGLWQALADPNQIESAVLNLVMNARHAMPTGGRLTLRTENTVVDACPDASAADAVAGDYVTITVQDTGVGMDEATLARAFEPFFTTREPGSGSGLGLSQVYGFAKQSKGHVTLGSRPGEGTTVAIHLPRLTPGQAAGHDTGEATLGAPRPVRGETILVVEDHDDVRSYCVEALCELGYDVLDASDSASAFEMLGRHKRIRLLFADIGLPGTLDGRGLANACLRRWPDLKVLLTTGYVHLRDDTSETLDAGVEILAKPFTFEALAAGIRRILDGQSLTKPPHHGTPHTSPPPRSSPPPP